MMFRRVPPVYSPISVRALWRGLATALSPSAAARARGELDDWVRRTYEPADWLWTDSGTSALMLALRLAEAAGHRRVALPAYGCYDLATACDGADVEVALYDVDPATLGPDWESLEGVLTGGANILVVAHLHGIPVDLDRARALASRFGAALIEDAAQGVGGSWAGRPLGAHGQLGILSFGRGKGLTAGGGGLLLARGEWGERLKAIPPLAEGGRGLGRLAKAVAQWAFSDPSVYWIPAGLPFLGLGETVYRIAHPPAGMNRAGLGILSVTSRTIGEEAAGRKERAAQLLRLAGAALRWQAINVPESREAGWLRFPCLLEAPFRPGPREAALGVMPGYPGTLGALSGFSGRALNAAMRFPGAETLVRRLATLPTHGLQDQNDYAALVSWLKG